MCFIYYNFLFNSSTEQAKQVPVYKWEKGYSKCLGEGNGTPLQYSCLENTMDGGAWWSAVHGVAKSETRLSNFAFTFRFHALEKETETYSNVRAWRISGMRESGGLPSMGSHRVGPDWSDLAAAAKCPTLANAKDLFVTCYRTVSLRQKSANISVTLLWYQCRHHKTSEL